MPSDSKDRTPIEVRSENLVELVAATLIPIVLSVCEKGLETAPNNRYNQYTSNIKERFKWRQELTQHNFGIPSN